jgi:hypothetical protein
MRLTASKAIHEIGGAFLQRRAFEELAPRVAPAVRAGPRAERYCRCYQGCAPIAHHRSFRQESRRRELFVLCSPRIIHGSSVWFLLRAKEQSRFSPPFRARGETLKRLGERTDDDGSARDG